MRGYSVLAALCDEIAFWQTDDAAEPDFEILNALRPAMSMIPNAMLLCAQFALRRARVRCGMRIGGILAGKATRSCAGRATRGR